MFVRRASRWAVLVCATALIFDAAACGGSDHATVTPSVTLATTAFATERPENTPAAIELAASPSTTPGPAATIELSAVPQALTCDDEHSSAVTARVLDRAGQPVNDGTAVKFSVQTLGTADPIDTKTQHGDAQTSVTALGERAGVVVNVTSGDAAAAIRIDCM